MKLSTGWAACAALVLSAAAATAQMPADGAVQARYLKVSDLDGPYGPPEAPAPGYGYGYGYEYERAPAPALLPAEEVYAVLRENGFSPLGVPHLRGYVYTIAAIDPRGDDGRLVIDARDGRIVRFIPAYGEAPTYGPGAAFEEGTVAPYGARGALPPPIAIRGVPRPPALIPHVASRAVPVPRAAPPRGDVPTAAAAQPASSESVRQGQPPQPSATAQARPQDATAVPQAAAPIIGQARPAATILPTQEMPPVQELE